MLKPKTKKKTKNSNEANIHTTRIAKFISKPKSIILNCSSTKYVNEGGTPRSAGNFKEIFRSALPSIVVFLVLLLYSVIVT